ncbi:MAG: efflux transporter periplasmic adaptor subunit [Proteobacteria bacterium]|nr:efflux transporter periplasmic adaptor subunit [Pseudomonadota bacterium]
MTGAHPLTALFVLAILTACSHDSGAPVTKRTVLVQRVAVGAPIGASTLTGEIRARHEVDLAFRVGGKVAARLVDAGASVKAGTPLARLDPADLKLAAQAAQAQLAAAQSDAATAKMERERYANLLEKKFISQAAFDARDNIAKAAAARLSQAQAQTAASGNQLSYGSLLADRDGVITQVFADAGQVVAPGQPVMRLAQPEEMEVAVAVPESRLRALRNARSLEVSLWALPELKLKGELRELAPAADAATRTFAARIRIANPPAAVRLGMTARVAVFSEREAVALVVPTTAIVDQGKGAAVWIVVDNKLKRQPVTVGQFREDGVLLSTGLKGGETIVVVGAHRLTEGQHVETQTMPEKAQ